MVILIKKKKYKKRSLKKSEVCLACQAGVCTFYVMEDIMTQTNKPAGVCSSMQETMMKLVSFEGTLNLISIHERNS